MEPKAMKCPSAWRAMPWRAIGAGTLVWVAFLLVILPACSTVKEATPEPLALEARSSAARTGEVRAIDAPPPADTLRAYGKVIDAAGNAVRGEAYIYREAGADEWQGIHTGKPDAITGPVLGRGVTWTGLTVGLVSSEHEGGPGFFDVPGGLPEGRYALDVHAADGTQAWAWPLVVNANGDKQVVRLGGPAPEVPEPPPVGSCDVTGPYPKITPLARQLTRGTYTAYLSLYGLLGAPIEQAVCEVRKFRKAGFGGARVWVDWGYLEKYPSPNSSLFARDAVLVDGKWQHPVIPEIKAKVDRLLAEGEAIGFSFDFTMQAKFYKAVKRSAEGYDIAAHKAAVRYLLTEWGNRPAFRLLDVANEAEVRGPGNHGSPDTGHVSPARFAELMAVARSIPRTTLVGVSISAAGQRGDVTANYADIFRDTRGEILLPHWPRKVGSGAREGSLSSGLRARFGIEVYNQEPFRRGYNVGYDHGAWPLSEFENLFKTTKAAGTLGACFHTEAGFDVTKRSAWEQLDPVERAVVESLAGWIGAQP